MYFLLLIPANPQKTLRDVLSSTAGVPHFEEHCGEAWPLGRGEVVCWNPWSWTVHH